MIDSVVGSYKDSVLIMFPRTCRKFTGITMVMFTPTSCFRLSLVFIQLNVEDVLRGLVNPGGSMPTLRQHHGTIFSIFKGPGDVVGIALRRRLVAV